MTIQEFLIPYNKSFKEITEQYSDIFIKVYNNEQEKNWLVPIESKLDKFSDNKNQEDFRYVIDILKSENEFTQDDISKLSTFVSKVNLVVKVADRINNFKQATPLEDGSQLQLVNLFNTIKSTSSLKNFTFTLNKNLNNFRAHIFSVIKHCQSPDLYPVYYPFWQKVSKHILKIENDYDSICEFYRTFPEENRTLNFGSYYGTLIKVIINNVNSIYDEVSKKTIVDFLKKEVINLSEYQNLLDTYLNKSYSKKTFEEVINDFRSYIKSEQNELSDFIVLEVNANSRWVWILDNNKIINDIVAHYEIIARRNKVYVEIHFEGNQNEKDVFTKSIKNLPEKAEWFSWQKSQSIRYKDTFSFNDNLLLEKLSDALLYLEKNIGDKVREIKQVKISNNQSLNVMGKSPYNQILYGPPGTGKTYNTINKSLSIIEDKSEDEINKENRDILKSRFDNYVKNGRIVFTTFHQSMSYEDFIEGIKPHTKNEKVTYSVEDGLFKQIVKSALSEYLEVPEVSSSDESFDTIFKNYIDSIKSFSGKREGIFTTKTGVEMMLVDVNENSLLIKYLWSNKKKDSEGQHTFSVTKEKLKLVLQEGIDPAKVKNLKTELHPIVGHIHCELFAVYKSFYDFVIANKGELDAVHFSYKDQNYNDVMEQFDLLDRETIKNKVIEPFILIIDEINRGNVSQIFGELITLIEDSKRLGNEEELQVTLPYSKTKFGVPSNLYIIGTMNTADRSVEALDTALRRRFSFVEMMPDSKVVEEKQFSDFPRVQIMQKINQRIELLLDKNYTLGHSYFLKDNLRSSFKNEIIPLLQEYFYNDCGKIGLILGKGFVREKEISKASQQSVFADFETRNELDIAKSYELIPFEDIDFNTAIESLLG